MITICMGRREVGKTTLALYMARQSTRQVLFDPRALMPCDESSQRDQVDVDELYEVLDADAGVLVYQPLTLQPSADALGAALTSWVRSSPYAPRVAVVVDESSLIDLSSWEWLIRCSARDRFDLILTAHRPRDIHTTIRALADTWLIFRTVQPHDLKAIADRCGEDTAEVVARLTGREIVVWDDARGERRSMTNPSAWYVPLANSRAVDTREPIGDREPSTRLFD